MTITEAMRLGATLSGQAFYELEDADGNTCAMGAVIKVVTGTARWTPEATRLVWWMTGIEVPCPGCRLQLNDNVIKTVIHLNNHHKWTRERIADWLEPIEALQPVALMPVMAEVKKEEVLCLA